ncbi:hypothetical protein MRX96_018003 [Rhipicephalus microplus]
MDCLLATSELAGIPVTAHLPADRSQSSGVVQGVDGDYNDEALHGSRDVRGAGDCSQVTRDITSLTVRLSRASHPGPPFSHGVRSEASVCSLKNLAQTVEKL